ncbi:MAG: hypothetical protein AAF799_28265 [Myxococcota bacterium]
MHTRLIRSLFLSAAVAGFAGCGDDSTGDSSDSANDDDTTTDAATTEVATSEVATTDVATTDASTTDAATTDAETTDAATTDAEDESTSDDATAGAIDVTVNYDGAGEGTLTVVVNTSFPPMGPPVAFVTDMEPTFPWEGSIPDVPVGDYFVFAVLDIGNDNPTIPGPEDAQSDAAEVAVDGAGPFPAEVTLVDPAQ